MRHVVVLTGLILTLIATTGPAGAQVRGRLTSRPPIPSAGPRSPGTPVSPVLPFPVWWNWSVAALPEPLLLEQTPVGDQAPKGGLQLDVQPWSAQVYVDGTLAGRVEQFRGYYQHLELPAGPHTIAIVADGRDPLIFSVMVVPGRVVTQRASLSSSGNYIP
jgi:hypothetical protein